MGDLDDVRLLVRATVNLQGLTAGETARVDPTDAYIAELLEATFLVPVPVAGATPRDSGHAGG